MSGSLRQNKVLIGVALAILVIVSAIGLLLSSPKAQAAGLVFLTRLNTSIRTYPVNDSFNVGYSATTTAPTAKLSATLGVTDTYASGLEIASTTGTGTATTTADLLRVNRSGCIQVTSTSSATQLKLTFTATTTQGSTNNFVVDAAYGTCSP